MTTVYLERPEQLKQLLIDNADKLVVLDFYADWCGPCKMVGTLFEKELLLKYPKTLVLVKIDSDKTELESLTNQFQVRGIPRLIFYNKALIVEDMTGYKADAIRALCKTYC